MYQSALSEFLKACEGTVKQGFMLPLSQIHLKDAYKKLYMYMYISISVYHKSVEDTKAKFNHFIVFRTIQIWNKCVTFKIGTTVNRYVAGTSTHQYLVLGRKSSRSAWMRACRDKIRTQRGLMLTYMYEYTTTKGTTS